VLARRLQLGGHRGHVAEFLHLALGADGQALAPRR
jgi:hypothetical protein